MQTAVQQLIDSVDEVASLPGICGRVNALISDPDSTVRALAQLISQDPGLSIKLLRIANSVFYGRAKDIETVEEALNVIGMQRTGEIVLGTVAMNTFSGIPNELVTMEDFWMHSLYRAIAARLLAKRINSPAAESIFIAGLGFAEDPQTLLVAKTGIISASLLAGLCGYLWLRFLVPPYTEEPDASDNYGAAQSQT